MALRTNRRALLRATGTVAAATLAGCGAEPTPTRGGSTTYAIAVVNQLKPSDFEDAEELSGPEPATVHLTVEPLDPGAEETFFEATATVEVESTRTYDGAFTVTPDGPTYAVSAELEPYPSPFEHRADHLNGGLTFAPDERPRANPIPVVVKDLAPPERDDFDPAVEVREQPLPG